MVDTSNRIISDEEREYVKKLKEEWDLKQNQERQLFKQFSKELGGVNSVKNNNTPPSPTKQSSPQTLTPSAKVPVKITNTQVVFQQPVTQPRVNYQNRPKTQKEIELIQSKYNDWVMENEDVFSFHFTEDHPILSKILGIYGNDDEVWDIPAILLVIVFICLVPVSFLYQF